MIALQSGVRVYLACGYTDIRKGMQGLAMLVQQVLAEDPFNACCMRIADAVAAA
jgi:transposase